MAKEGSESRERQPQAGRRDAVLPEDSLHGREVAECGQTDMLGFKSTSFYLDALQQVTQLLQFASSSGKWTKQ